MNVDMNTSAVVAQANSSSEISMAVFKIAIDSEAQGAMALIAAIPQAPQTSSANLPAHLGQNINITA